MRKAFAAFGIFLAFAAGNIPAVTAQTVIQGAGATFPHPVYAWWALRYGKQYDTKLLYDAIGSGGGIKRIEGRTADFGASDAPLSQAELDKYGLIQFPTVLGGVVPVIHVPGIPKGTLRLNGSLLADIFLGRISNWNDAALAALNPGIKLPNLPITVVHRTRGSGTTWIFTNYLNKVSVDWQQRIGVGKVVAWPAGVAAIGNGGILETVNATPGAVGYCEYAYVVQSDSNYALLQNHAGQFVQPNRAAFQAAADSGNWSGQGEDLVLTDMPGRNAWPIAGATFILMYKKQENPEIARAILHFFDWCYRKGDDIAGYIDYVTLSDQLVDNIRREWSRDLRGPFGEIIWQ
ncbi:MAG TPA: phosphate ABC transporter substrate-binding protein PstS [Mariprofundaceae bacterium]|nr:phosphate ABC transporter substrate-binding protein PstS [Mariprofundaceae bacterium]